MRQCRAFVGFIALLVGAAVPASVLASCMADQSSAATTQMACCKTAKPECGTTSKGTMECCKSGAHPDQQNVTKLPTVANPLETLIAGPVPTLAHALEPFVVRRPVEPAVLHAGTTSPPHLAFSALLI
jgi:hypothetical protein